MSASSGLLKARNRVLPGFEETEQSTKWEAPFFFIQAADPQLGLIANYGDGTIVDQYPNINWDKEMELCAKSVEVINRLHPKPKFFVVCGDLVDAFPEKWPEIRKRQEEDLLAVYSQLNKDIPLVCVCGNHDVGNTPTMETVQKYRETFGDDYFSFWVKGVQFLVINSQYYEDASQVPELAKAQTEWLEEQLDKGGRTPRKHLLVFQHIPWFVSDPDEKKFYFNIEEGTRKRMLQKFHDAGTTKIFCGHYHRNAGGYFKEMELVVTTAIGCQIGPDTHGMRVVVVKKDKVEHQFHSLQDFPEHVAL